MATQPTFKPRTVVKTLGKIGISNQPVEEVIENLEKLHKQAPKGTKPMIRSGGYNQGYFVRVSRKETSEEVAIRRKEFEEKRARAQQRVENRKKRRLQEAARARKQREEERAREKESRRKYREKKRAAAAREKERERKAAALEKRQKERELTTLIKKIVKEMK